jgi:large subunit ribosomal protein L24
MQRLKKNDEIVVIAGKDKGKRGSVRRVYENGKVVVDGINLVKRHTRPNPNQGIAGGIVEKEMPINVSNVAIFNPESSRADRVGFKLLEDGRKVRYFKSTGEVIDS